jgi:hypothetical protein
VSLLDLSDNCTFPIFVNFSYLSIHFTVPNFGEYFVSVHRFYRSYFRDFLYLYIDYTCPISLPVLFSGVLYLYIRCTRISILPVLILAIFVPVHRYTGPTFLRFLVPVRLLYRSFFLSLSYLYTSYTGPIFLHTSIRQ